MNDRIPPYNTDAENACLGAMIVNPNAIPVVLDVVGETDFFQPRAAAVFQVIKGLWATDPGGVDRHTVAAAVDDEYALYVSHLVDIDVVSTNARHYAGIVKHMSVCRQLVYAGQAICDLGYGDGSDYTALIDQAEEQVYAIRPATDGSVVTAKEVAHIIMQDVADGRRPKIESTGFDKLDEVCGGLHASNLIIVGARPGVGKTAVALSIAHNVSANGTVLFFSLEMSRGELLERLMCSEACVPVTALRARELDANQISMLHDALPKIEERDLRIIDSPRMSITDMRSKVRQYASKTDVKLIVVDYIQLLRMGNRAQSRNEEVAQISGELKALARETNVPVLALSQLNRQSVYDGATPSIAHLRDSGALEQDADQVWLLSWPEDPDFAGASGLLDVQIAKNRNGQRGKISLVWNRRWQRIEE